LAKVSRRRSRARHWQDQRAPLILSSGRVDAPMIAGQLIKKAKIPRSVVVQERCSLSTAENAEFTAAILLHRGLSKIILVTDSLHMLRSLLTFKSFGFEVIPYPVTIPADTGKRRFIEFRESLGAISYGLTGRYFSKEISEETIVEADKLVAQQLKNGAATAIENY
ncbi:MAG: YdcF family protein, partial [Cyanobacteria bacterium J06621_11]